MEIFDRDRRRSAGSCIKNTYFRYPCHSKTKNQCFGSAWVSMRIWIQHFRSMRIGNRFRIRIQIPTKNCENLHMKFFFYIFDPKIAIYLSRGLQKGSPRYSPQKRTIFTILDSDPSHQNQCGSGSETSIKINNLCNPFP